MIRFSKCLFLNPAKIWISGLKCNCDNIMKIVDIFGSRWLTVAIDSVTEGSSLLTLIKEQRLEYFAKHHSTKCEVSIRVPYALFEDILEKAIKEDPENIFVFNLLDPVNWDVHWQRPFEDLVSAGITDMSMSISLDENALLISVNKSILPPQEIYSKMKALRFD